MIRRRTLRTRSIKMLVLDEADEMLNKGFKEQIYDVYRYLPPQTQVIIKLNVLSYCLYFKCLNLSSGCSPFCHSPSRDLGNDEQVHDRSNSNFSQTVIEKHDS